MWFESGCPVQSFSLFSSGKCLGSTVIGHKYLRSVPHAYYRIAFNITQLQQMEQSSHPLSSCLTQCRVSEKSQLVACTCQDHSTMNMEFGEMVVVQ